MFAYAFFKDNSPTGYPSASNKRVLNYELPFWREIGCHVQSLFVRCNNIYVKHRLAQVQTQILA